MIRVIIIGKKAKNISQIDIKNENGVLLEIKIENII